MNTDRVDRPTDNSEPISDQGCYRASGFVAWVNFLPLAILSVISALCMAWCLGFTRHYGYFLLVLPIVFSLPIFATILLAIYFGKCRNRYWACMLAMVAVGVFYFGSWVASYHYEVVQYGPAYQRAVKDSVGVPGVVGFFILLCQAEAMGFVHGPLSSVPVQVAIRGLEPAILFSAGLFLSRRLAGRVFFEDYGRWASSRAFGFRRADLATVLKAVELQQWDGFKGLEMTGAAVLQSQRGVYVFRAEYLPGSTDQPVFVTVEGPIAPRILMALVPFLGRLKRRWISQVHVSPRSAQELRHYFGGMSLGKSSAPGRTDQTESVAGSPIIRYWNREPGTAVSTETSGLVSLFLETGLGGVSLVGTAVDFRSSVSDTSLKLIEGAATDISRMDSSLCYPAEPHPLSLLRTLSRINLLISYLVFGSVGIGLAALFLTDIAGNSGNRGLVLFSGCVVVVGYGVAGLGLLSQLFLFAPIVKAYLTRYFSGRSGAWESVKAHDFTKRLVRIEDPATFHISKRIPEDWGLLYTDAANTRLLIEGISHRYIIRGGDVISIAALRGLGVNARIEYRIDGRPFAIVLNRYGMGGAIVAAFSAYPGIGWIVRLVAGDASARFVHRLKNTLWTADSTC